MDSKEVKNSFILELPLLCSKSEIQTLEKIFDVARSIYNICLSEVKDRINTIRQDKRFKEAKELSTADNDKKYKIYNDLQTEFGMNGEYAIHKFVTTIKQHYNYLDAHVCQKLATRAYNAGKKYMLGKAKKLNFKKYGTMDSIECKSADAGIRFDKDKMLLTYLKLFKIKVKLNPKDTYAQEALLNRIKYCRINKKMIRGEARFFVQLIMDGIPPIKRNKDGTFKHQIGTKTDKVGIDIGPSTIATTSKNEVNFFELADGIKEDDKIKRILQRKLDRSKRHNNPNNYNEDGTITKGPKEWVRSNTYMKTLYKLNDINRKITQIRKAKHSKAANDILRQGLDVRIEKTNFKGLQKRSAKTEISEKTGKLKKKKRFGKSIGIHAPGMFVSILRQKLKYHNTFLKEIPPTQLKASQYNHYLDEYVKKSLNNRWNIINGEYIQRDCYSSNLIYNTDETINKTTKEVKNKKTNQLEIKEITEYSYKINTSNCNKNYETFKIEHDKLMLKLKDEILKGRKFPTCMGTKKIREHF